MAEAVFARNTEEVNPLAAAAVGVGDVWQMPDGRAGYALAGYSSGARARFRAGDVVTVAKTANIVLLAGGRVYWDFSANSATFEKVNDRDFYIGRAYADATSAATFVDVILNVDPPYDVDVLRGGNGGALSVPVGTQAIGGFGLPKILGGSQSLELTATNEAQKIDLLSVDGFATGANAIIEIVFRVPDDGAGTAADLSLGVANGTNATDADLITESVFFHLDANNTTILAESDDGTTEVAATSTTKTYSEGSAVANRVECWIDMRDPADCQLYVDGVLILAATVFNVNLAVGPWFLLAHLEKTLSTDVYRAVIDRFCARLMEQGPES